MSMTGFGREARYGGTADVVDGHEFVAENACNRRRLMFVGGRPFGIVGYDADVHLSSFCVGRMSSGGQPFFGGCRGRRLVVEVAVFAEGVRWSEMLSGFGELLVRRSAGTAGCSRDYCPSSSRQEASAAASASYRFGRGRSGQTISPEGASRMYRGIVIFLF